MECSSCGHSNRNQAKFCESCGTSLRLICASCEAELRSDAKFCDSCGAPVAAQAPSKSSPDKSRPGIQEGERRVVSVLFADAVGHTPTSERLDEEELYNLMQGCFSRMQASVERFGGTVNQYTGDGILALFGAPVAYEDSARRAVLAGLDMQRSLKEYAAEVRKQHPIDCAYRVGINTGPVVVGSISEKLDLDYAAVGDTVNLAARMESLAVAGTVFLTENTYRSVHQYIDCESLGPKEIKGKSEPVVVYRAIGEGGAQSRIEASVERGLTPYTGRDEEQAMLQSYLKKAERGQGQVVFVSGEAGMGKSRLLLEFRRSVQDKATRWISGQCISFGENIPYLPVIDLLKSTFDIAEADSEADIIAKVDEGVASWSERATDTMPYIKYLLNVDPNDDALATMDPLERRAGFFDAFRAVVTELSQEAPLVILIEDMHWIDTHSEEVIQSIVDTTAAAPLLVIFTARPEYTNTMGDRSYFSRLALTHLAPEDGAMLAERALGATDLPAELKKLIGQKAEGNPFYIEEVTRSLVEIGALQESNDSYSLGAEVSDIRIPDTIQEVILARIDRLPPKAKEAMQLASVIGREFTVRLLNRISDLEDTLTATLDDLKSLELIYESGYMPELSYMFKHALTHDVAYSTLLLERRKALHNTVGRAIETLFEDRLAEHYEALAHHFEESQNWDKALDYHEKAGDKAASAYANQEAIDYYTHALHASDKQGEESTSRRLEIAEKRAWVNFTISNYADAAESANLILKVAQDSANSILETHALTLIGFFRTYEHDFEAAEKALVRANQLSEGQDDPELLFMSRSSLYALNKLLNRHDEAQQQKETIDALVPKVSSPLALSNWYFFAGLDANWKGDYTAAALQAASWRELPEETPQVMLLHIRWSEALVYAGMGKYTEAVRLLWEIASDCERIGEIAVRARALNTIGWIFSELQNTSRAIELSDLGSAVALEEGDEPEKISNARLNWGDSLTTEGRFDEADRIFAEVGQVIRDPKPQDRWMLWRFSQHYFHSYGKLCFATDKPEEALGLADECLQLAEHSESKKYIVKARRLRSRVLLASGDVSGARAEMDTAIQVAGALGNPPQLWKSLAALSKVLKAENNTAGADEALSKAAKVVAKVAESLEDESVRKAFLNSQEVQRISP